MQVVAASPGTPASEQGFHINSTMTSAAASAATPHQRLSEPSTSPPQSSTSSGASSSANNMSALSLSLSNGSCSSQTIGMLKQVSDNGAGATSSLTHDVIDASICSRLEEKGVSMTNINKSISENNSRHFNNGSDLRNGTNNSNSKSLRNAIQSDSIAIASSALMYQADLENEVDSLDFSETQHPSSVLAGINKLRQQRQFCDISLLIQEQEFPTHRAVLAACSPHLFDFLSCLEETTEQQPIYKLDKDIPAAGFTPLLDYMYTGRLTVPVENVPIVYATALNLKMEAATRACANFLSTHLTTANCLGIRLLVKDKAFKETVDKYICDNLDDIINSKDFYGLTEMQVEVVGLDEDISDEAMERRMFSLVLDWAKNNLNDLKPKMDRLLEQVNVLYLDSDNTLRDCAQIEDLVLSSDDEVVQDYKIMARRRSQHMHHSKKDKGKHSVLPLKNPGAQPFQKFSLNPEEALSMAEREWTIIAIHRTSDKAYLAIAMLDGHLMAVSVHVRPQVPNNTSMSASSSNGHLDNLTNGCAGTDRHGNKDSVINGGSKLPDSPRNGPVMSSTNGGGSSPTSILRKASIIPLANMTTARCAMGAAEMDGKLVVCGGYDRGECLQACEAFNIASNSWEVLPAMQRARGRFSMAVLDGQMYVCGGSDGWFELACVEKFDPASQTWSYVASMNKHRSSHGLATMKGKLYCVGGCEGQHSMKECEVYDPATNKWSKIAPLNTARSQACVVVVEDNLLAIGGTDMWNTLSSVEVYDPVADQWTLGTCLNTARRGAAVDVLNGQVVVVGGSDGSHSLTTVEVFDTDSNSWVMGPPLIVPRANLSVVSMADRLFAIGGFSGKKFLSSIEWLDMESLEWFGHTPRELGKKPVENGKEVESL